MQTQNSRIVVYKPCKRDTEAFAREVDAGRVDCVECRRATFRATMKARGISIQMPTCKAKYPVACAYVVGHTNSSSGFSAQLRTVSDEEKLEIWRRNSFVSSMS